MYCHENGDRQSEQEYRLLCFDDFSSIPEKINSRTLGLHGSHEYRKILITLSQHIPNLRFYKIRHVPTTQHKTQQHAQKCHREEMTNISHNVVDDQTLSQLMTKHQLAEVYDYFQRSK